MAARSTNYGRSSNSEQLKILKEQLKENSPANLYIFSGEETFLIDHYINELKKTILGDDVTGLNLAVFGSRFDIDDLLDVCDTYPIMAEKRLVIVKDSGLFNASKKKANTDSKQDENKGKLEESKNTAPAGNRAQEALINYISEIPETTCLLFIEKKVDKRLKIYKQVVKQGLALEFNRIKEGELANWVRKGFRALGKEISGDAAQYLVAICEDDMYFIRNEIFKLAAYVSPKNEVTINDIKLLVIPTIKSVIFDLLDAVVGKNTQKALTLLNDMLILKEPEQKIMSMLSKQTGEILKLKIMMDERASQAQINEVFKGKHPYAMRIMTQQASRMDTGYLRKFLKACVDAEMNYKKGLMTPRLALELLLR